MNDRTPHTEEAFSRLVDRLHHWLDRLEAADFRTQRDEPDASALAQLWRPGDGFQTIDKPALIAPSDLLHIERQLDQIERNTRLFLEDQAANHVLLWGARGTGKSSLIRAMLQRYGGQELGMIELDRDALTHLPDLTRSLSRQPRKYILFVDDLSFEAHDASYKSLKALLDGSLMAPPDNVLVYATSNRRHLLPETMQDNLSARVVDGELHEGDALDEKISLSERFGLWLAFHSFDQEQYLAVVAAKLQEIDDQAEPQAVREAALRFARLRGSRSGRVAAQFVRFWQADHLNPPHQPNR